MGWGGLALQVLSSGRFRERWPLKLLGRLGCQTAKRFGLLERGPGLLEGVDVLFDRLGRLVERGGLVLVAPDALVDAEEEAVLELLLVGVCRERLQGIRTCPCSGNSASASFAIAAIRPGTLNRLCHEAGLLARFGPYPVNAHGKGGSRRALERDRKEGCIMV